MSNRSRERIEKYLYRQLMLLHDGAKLPSVRTIMQECESSQAPVQTVLKKYESDGLIRCNSRRGYFKSKNSTVTDTFEELDLIYCTNAQDEDPLMKFHGEFSHLLGRMCGESWRSVRMHFLEGKGNIERFEQLARNCRCRACIIIASPGAEIGQVMKKHHVAYVNLFPEASQLDDNSVNVVIDNEKVINAQIEYLLELGHRKIGYIHCLRDNECIRDLVLRREAFYRQSLLRKLPLKPNWIQFGGYDSDTCIEAMSKIMSGDDCPTAVISSDHHIPAIYQVLNDHNLVPGEDFSVLGTDNLPITQIVTPQASSLDISRASAARLAIDALEKLMRGEIVDNNIYVDSKVVERQSTKPLEP